MVAPLFAVGQRYTTQDRKFYKLQSKSLLGNVTIVSQVKDHYDCSFMCVKYGHLTCLSFNFNTTVNEDGFHFCELSNSERYLEPQKTQEMPGNDYYGTATEVSHVETCKCRTNTVYGLPNRQQILIIWSAQNVWISPEKDAKTPTGKE